MPDGEEKRICFSLDAQTLVMQNQQRASYPDWTKLDCHQCPHCPFDPETRVHCPVAVNIHEVVTIFASSISYEEVNVRVITEEREYSRKVPMQKAVSSLLGIGMVACDCPIMAKLKHMVRFHLPFATPLETLQRTLSSYLLAQYFRKKEGKTPDWNLAHLKKIYEDIRKLNVAMRDRLLATGKGDANVNAIVRLDVLAITATDFLEGNLIGHLEGYFDPYLK